MLIFSISGEKFLGDFLADEQLLDSTKFYIGFSSKPGLDFTISGSSNLKLSGDQPWYLGGSRSLCESF